MKTQKQYFLHNMRSAYFTINREYLERERERERVQDRERDKDRERERETERARQRGVERERGETVKTQKQYFGTVQW